MGRLAGKTAIVTGAASGVGEATAIRFAQEGAEVVVADINSEGIERVVGAIKAAGGRAIGVTVDVSDIGQIKKCVSDGIAAFGKLDIVINNAGMPSSHGSTFAEDPWDKGIATTLSSVYWVSNAALPHLKVQGGTIVNISSLAGNTMGMPVTWYASAKAGVVGLTRSMATTHGRSGIRTNAICLGAVDTPRLRKILDVLPEQEAIHDKRSPIGRVGRPEEIAAVALFLASDESSYINGEAIVADGGFSIAG